MIVWAAGSLACERPDKTVSEELPRSAPWPVGDGRDRNEGQPLSHFRVAPGQELMITMPAREGEPRAHLRGISGELWVDEQDLARCRGWVEFDLSTLNLLSDGGEPDSERTRLAGEWLGPWTEPSAKLARLEITSFAAPSSRRFDQGDRVSQPNGGAARRVRGTLAARLTIRRVATDQRISIVADLMDSNGPPELRVRLQPKASVSLLEHDIVPRDAQGVPIAEDRTLLGRVVGSRALISGELRWIAADERSPRGVPLSRGNLTAP